MKSFSIGRSPSERAQIVLTVALLTAAGAFVRLYGLGAWDYYDDEMWHVYVAEHSSLASVFYSVLIESGHPFLPYVLWHYALLLWNDPWMARLPSLIAGILAIPMGYILGREIFASRSGGLFAAFFMAFSNLLIDLSDVVRGYMLMVLFSMIAVWCVYCYRHARHFGCMLGYFLAMSGAFLCEFTVVPIAVFTALYLLEGIRRQPSPRLTALLLWALMHLVWLGYLVEFIHQIRDTGMIDLSLKYDFLMIHHASPLYNISQLIIYFIDFINEAGFVLFPAMASGSGALAMVGLMLSLFTALAGFAWLVRYRRWGLLAWTLLTVALTVAFFYLDIITIDRSRHAVGLIFPYMILLYGGGIYWLRHGFRNNRWQPRAIPTVLVATLLLSLGYAAYGEQWRATRPLEFQQTRAQADRFFAFIDAHVRKNDIIITDSISFHHLWYRLAPCPAVPLAPTWKYNACYRAPVFIKDQEVRGNLYLPMNPRQMQEGLKELSRLHRLEGVENIWVVGVQHADNKWAFLMPHYRRTLLYELPPPLRAHPAPEIEQAIHEQETLARSAFEAARFRKIYYRYSCGKSDDESDIGGDNYCVMDSVAMALPREWAYTQLIDHPAYSDPAMLVINALKSQYIGVAATKEKSQ